jgi:hypothetical protein
MKPMIPSSSQMPPQKCALKNPKVEEPTNPKYKIIKQNINDQEMELLGSYHSDIRGYLIYGELLKSREIISTSKFISLKIDALENNLKKIYSRLPDPKKSLQDEANRLVGVVRGGDAEKINEVKDVEAEFLSSYLDYGAAIKIINNSATPEKLNNNSKMKMEASDSVIGLVLNPGISESEFLDIVNSINDPNFLRPTLHNSAEAGLAQ